MKWNSDITQETSVRLLWVVVGGCGYLGYSLHCCSPVFLWYDVHQGKKAHVIFLNCQTMQTRATNVFRKELTEAFQSRTKQLLGPYPGLTRFECWSEQWLSSLIHFVVFFSTFRKHPVIARQNRS
jgi:hypothetical protein